MAFVLLSRSRSKPQGSVKSVPKQKSARAQHSADSRFGFAKPVFQPQTVALLTAPSVPFSSNRGGILQRKCACGGSAGISGECKECGEKQRLGLQTKLKVNEPGDIYEQEADRIADQVLAVPAHHAFSGAPLCIQRFLGQSNGQMDVAPASVERALGSPGRPLEPALRQDMEQRFGYDFSQVRVHSGAAAEQSAQELNANAYTVGHDIVFSAGWFAPGTHEGRRLIAHELTHVMQQNRGINRLQRFASCKPARLSMIDCPPREPGETQRAKNGPMHFLSLHVPPTLSGPVSGQGGALIANFDIGSAAIKPNLHQSVRWSLFLDMIASKRPRIEILGFSDCENEKKINKQIRERRAAEVFKILPQNVRSQVSSHEGASEADCITENSTAGDRTLNRSVAILFETSVADFSPEVIETPSREFICGPDVTQQVADAVNLTKSIFKGWTPDKREDACDALISFWKGDCAWDIVQLSPHKRAWIHEKGRPLCATKGAKPPCGETVQIDDDCHHAGSVNYVIFGTMFRLCSDEDPHWIFDYSKSNMKAIIDLYKGSGKSGLATPAPNFQGSMAWAKAGYDGWPSGVSSPYGDWHHCTPICPLKYADPKFEVIWYPHHTKPGWCGLGT